MDTVTKQYIETVKVSDIPWHRLTTTYGRATDFPAHFKVLWDMKNVDAIDAAGEELAQNIEHQSTLWHATPFAMVFLLRIFKKALEERTQNEVAHYLVEQLVDLFTVIAECIRDGLMLEHADQLPNFADMLNEEYLGLKSTMKTKMFSDMRKRKYSLLIYFLASITTHCKCFYLVSHYWMKLMKKRENC